MIKVPQPKFDFDQKVWAVWTNSWRKQAICPECEGVGTIEYKPTKTIVCPVCKGSKVQNYKYTHQCTHSEILGILTITRIHIEISKDGFDHFWGSEKDPVSYQGGFQKITERDVSQNVWRESGLFATEEEAVQWVKDHPDTYTEIAQNG